MTGCTRGGIEGRRGKRPVALGNGKCSTAAKSMTNGGGGRSGQGTLAGWLMKTPNASAAGVELRTPEDLRSKGPALGLPDGTADEEK